MRYLFLLGVLLLTNRQCWGQRSLDGSYKLSITLFEVAFQDFPGLEFPIEDCTISQVHVGTEVNLYSETFGVLTLVRRDADGERVFRDTDSNSATEVVLKSTKSGFTGRAIRVKGCPSDKDFIVLKYKLVGTQ